MNNSLPNSIRVLSSISGTFLILFGFYHTVKKQKALHISISGIGQIRINKLGTSLDKGQYAVMADESALVYLLNDSTILPYLIILHLCTKSGKIIIVPILPDCISRDDFRALSVACKWVINHHR